MYHPLRSYRVFVREVRSARLRILNILCWSAQVPALRWDIAPLTAYGHLNDPDRAPGWSFSRRLLTFALLS